MITGCNGGGGHSDRKMPLLQNHSKKSRLRSAAAHGAKIVFSVLCKISLSCWYDWKEKLEAFRQKNTISALKDRGHSIMLLQQEVMVCFSK